MSHQGESTPTNVLTVPSPSKNPAISCDISESTLGKNHSLAISAVDPLLSNPLLTVTWKPMGPVSCNKQRFDCMCVTVHFDGDWNLFKCFLCLVFMLRVKILILSVRNECSSREKYFIKICAIFRHEKIQLPHLWLPIFDQGKPESSHASPHWSQAFQVSTLWLEVQDLRSS